jgi:hypothetical protein
VGTQALLPHLWVQAQHNPQGGGGNAGVVSTPMRAHSPAPDFNIDRFSEAVAGLRSLSFKCCPLLFPLPLVSSLSPLPLVFYLSSLSLVSSLSSHLLTSVLVTFPTTNKLVSGPISRSAFMLESQSISSCQWRRQQTP